MGIRRARRPHVEFITDETRHDLQQTFFGLDIAGFDQVFALNFTGTLLPTMVFAVDMLEQGKGVILNISSMNSFRPLTKIPAYSAAKASINNFTQWLATHLAQAECPRQCHRSWLLPDQPEPFPAARRGDESLTPRGHQIIDGTPMGRFGKPDELLGTVLYLLSDVSGFVTGVVIPVDGGFNAYSGV